jgi:L-aspartate oxidase
LNTPSTDVLPLLPGLDGPGFDVIVVGAGAAGLYTALCLPVHLRVGLITKDTLMLSASDWAQGGIAAVVAPDDTTALHISDTLKAGAGLCDYAAVQFLVEQAQDCVQNLVAMGVAFDRHGADLALTLEAAHSRRRVLHAADTTGRAVVTTLAEQVLQRPNIQVIAQALVLDVWLDPQTHACQGVCLLYGAAIHWLRAGAVILATGGGGQVFAQTTNPAISTGDGVAIAHRAGAILRDLEFVQFHPTALTKAGAPRFLISEAVRGEGAHLVNDQGRRFAFDYDPAGELAPRDVVSRSIYRYLQAQAADPATAHVWLDLRPIPAERIRQRFPNIIQVCQHWGVDVFAEPIPVAPAAHYWMGGIATDQGNRTSVPNLYAVGETASTGVHGANRLASNSLLECLVYGAQFAHLNVRLSSGKIHSNGQSVTSAPVPPPPARDLALVRQIRQELPVLVWQSAGICRTGETLQQAIAQMEQWQQAYTALPLSRWLQQVMACPMHYTLPPEQEPELRAWAETRNLLAVAELILKSAAFRCESRGGHYRLDFPETDPHWQVHTLVQGNIWWKGAVQEKAPTSVG